MLRTFLAFLASVLGSARLPAEQGKWVAICGSSQNYEQMALVATNDFGSFSYELAVKIKLIVAKEAL